MLPLRGFDGVRALYDVRDAFVFAASRKHGTRRLKLKPALRRWLVEPEAMQHVVADGLDGQDARAGGVGHALGP